MSKSYRKLIEWKETRVKLLAHVYA